jgi:hypothetical protein
VHSCQPSLHIYIQTRTVASGTRLCKMVAAHTSLHTLGTVLVGVVTSCTWLWWTRNSRPMTTTMAENGAVIMDRMSVDSAPKLHKKERDAYLHDLFVNYRPTQLHVRSSWRQLFASPSDAGLIAPSDSSLTAQLSQLFSPPSSPSSHSSSSSPLSSLRQHHASQKAIHQTDDDDANQLVLVSAAWMPRHDELLRRFITLVDDAWLAAFPGRVFYLPADLALGIPSSPPQFSSHGSFLCST